VQLSIITSKSRNVQARKLASIEQSPPAPRYVARLVTFSLHSSLYSRSESINMSLFGPVTKTIRMLKERGWKGMAQQLYLVRECLSRALTEQAQHRGVALRELFR
jgi:hypothetical protein